MKRTRQRLVLTRREFLGLLGLGAGILAVGGCEALLPERRRSAPSAARVVEHTLEAGPVKLELGGRKVSTWGYNGGVMGPEIRLRQGDTLRVAVRNRLPEGTSVHWHGVPLPNEMDGVPGVTQRAIAAGESFTYQFEAADPGTYIYHSHAGLQLDRGLYGPLIVEPEREALSYDREFVVMLDDWLDGVDGAPEDAFEKLRSGGSEMAGMKDVDAEDMNSMGGMDDMGGMDGAAPPEWAPDFVYPLYLVNGKPAEAPEEFEVKEGEKVRLRLANPSGATIYRVALAGHRMTVTHADGQPVKPVEVAAVRIGQGERYDVLVQADNPGVWQLAAKAEGASEMARAIFRYAGSAGSPPPANLEPSELGGKVLTYDMLEAGTSTCCEAPPGGDPDLVVPVTLEGDEERYVWTINGQVFPEADEIPVTRDQHVRFEFENKTMMPHPMHLHGHFFRVDNGTGRGPMKDTVLVEPMQRLNIDWVADNPGDWAFHCHMLYHQDAGMMRVVRVA